MVWYIEVLLCVPEGGEGKSWVEWRTNLERVGKYKLFVHIPRFSAMNIMCKSNLLSQWGHKHIRVCYRKLDMKFQSTLLIAGGFLWVSMRVPPESVLSCYMIREIRIILLLGMYSKRSKQSSGSFKEIFHSHYSCPKHF